MADHLQLDAARAEVSFSSDALLGQGGFADVYRGTYRFPGRDTPADVAFKLFKNSRVLDAKLLELVKSEALVGLRLQDDHIVGVYGVLELDAGLALVLELAEGGSLWATLRAAEPPWQQRIEWLLGVARGIAYLHGVRPTPIIHRDLKAANVLLGSAANGRTIAKVTDFGLAQTMQTIRTTIGSHAAGSSRAGTLAWKAPETFRGRYSDKSDIFGFAMIVYETVSRAAPFEGQFDPEIMKKLSEHFKVNQRKLNRGDTAEEQYEDWLEDYPLADRRPDLARVEAGCPEPLLQLMQSCWADDPGSRPAAQDCVQLLEQLCAPASGGLFGPELHYAIEQNDIDGVRRLFENDRVHYNLRLHGNDVSAAQKSISPLQRAARYGHLQILRAVLDQAMRAQPVAAVIDAKTQYDHTALHWACAYGHANVVAELIERGCDTDLLNHRGKTAWDIAADYGDAEVLAVFEGASTTHEQLRQESIRRRGRPKVKETFRDDINLDPARLDLWSIRPFCQWAIVGEGTYGIVFDIIASPDLEVAGRRFRRIALKVAKQWGVAELKHEADSLARLSHPNVVRVLGVTYGNTKGSGEEKHWAMALEWCDLDLRKLLYEPELADPDGAYKPRASMCELMEQIAHGLAYIHEHKLGRPHLDLKPDNILLARAPSGQHQPNHVYIAKLADFGMTYQDDASTASASAQLQRMSSPSASAGEPPIDEDAIVPFGTWEYLSPECWKRKYGKPCFASDIFSFGLLIWEMLACSRISTHLLDADNPDHRVDEDGEVTLNVEAVPVLFVKGERPRHTGLQEEVREQRGWHVYYRLMQACWVSGIDERPTAALVAEALILAKSYAANATPEQAEKHIADLEAEVNSGGSVDANSADSVNGAAVISYDDFLAMVGLTDSRAELDEYLTSKDSNGKLEELKQYDEDDLEEEILDELELDEETKAIFHEQLKALKHSGVVADEQQVSEFDPAAVNAAARAAAEHEEQWPKWPALQTMLPGLRGLHEAAAQTLEEALAAKDIALACAVAAKDEELANALTAKEGELASVVAAKDLELVAQAGELAGALAELEQLRAQLGRIEGVPPQRE